MYDKLSDKRMWLLTVILLCVGVVLIISSLQEITTYQVHTHHEGKNYLVFTQNNRSNIITAPSSSQDDIILYRQKRGDSPDKLAPGLDKFQLTSGGLVGKVAPGLDKSQLAPDFVSASSSGHANLYGASTSDLIIFVHSTANHFDLRTAIRKTWGSGKEQGHNGFQLKFILGYGLNDEYMSRTLESEIKQYGDIIQVDVVESYPNLTLKSIEMLKWCLENCRDNIKYIVKTDDDVFLNIPNLKSKIRQYEPTGMGNEQRVSYFMMGHLIKDGEPIRERHSKYYMPKTMYRKDKYPDYLSGSAYTIPTAIIPNLLQNTAKFKNILWLEDIFITGILTKEDTIVELIHEDGFKISKREIRNVLVAVCRRGNITIHELTDMEIYELWSVLKMCL